MRAALCKKLLIAYDTRAGFTAEVAQRIAEILCGQGFEIAVLPISAVASVDGYDAIVLGSAVRYGAWLSEMNNFVDAHGATLQQLPTALFTLHMQALDESEQSRSKRAEYSKPARHALSPRSEAYFAGKIDLQTLSLFERMAVKMVKSEVGDKRDWQALIVGPQRCQGRSGAAQGRTSAPTSA